MASQDLDIKDYYVEDADSCTESELMSIFPLKYRVSKKISLSDSSRNTAYVKIAVGASEESLAIGSKNGEVSCYDCNVGNSLSTFKAHEQEVTGIRYCPTNNKIVYSCSVDGTVKVRDMRSNQFEHTYEYKNEGGKGMPFTCLDLNNTGEFLCTGTTFINEDAYLLFWDVRKQQQLLGAYADSHSDDVTAVHFHPYKRAELASAAMDNLINIFDVSKSSESDAFTQCINFETTPDSIIWDSHQDHESKLFAINFSQVIQYWDIEDTEPLADLKPKKYCKAMRRTTPEQCHFLSLNYTKTQDPILMFGSNLGLSTHVNACIRTLRFDRNKKMLFPHSALELQGSKTVEVFDSVYLPNSDIFVTLENGSLKYWSPQHKKRNLAEDAVSGEELSFNLKKQKL
ncbi:WD repeat-containing protein 89 [Hyalella azteca]|uniref:WD repeat-containing protein 89 n=1 Tax=Hyalella azteca TaxID=294128 RepID=A0A8B7P5T1_HYAAZ|nr:WD repeat-containing protein 89 [Hyalella azteca]